MLMRRHLAKEERLGHLPITRTLGATDWNADLDWKHGASLERALDFKLRKGPIMGRGAEAVLSAVWRQV